MHVLLQHWMKVILVFESGLLYPLVAFGQDVVRVLLESPVELSDYLSLLKIGLFRILKNFNTPRLFLGYLLELVNKHQKLLARGEVSVSLLAISNHGCLEDAVLKASVC